MSCFGSAKKAASGESRIVRPFGDMERYQAAYLSLQYYGSVAVTCRYSAPSTYRGEPERQVLYDAFERAVALTVLEHPLLQVGEVGRESKRPSWVRLDRIDLRNHIAWHTVEDASQSQALVLEILQASHDAPFTHIETRPSWKVNAVHCPAENFIEAVFTYSHTIGDGTSGKVFHLTLLEKLNGSGVDTPVQLDGHILEVPLATNFTPTSEELLQIKLTPGFILGEFFKLVRPQRFAPAIRSCDSWAPIRLGPLNSRVRVVRVEDDALQVCLKACRQHGTTLTGLVHALALASLVARTADDDNDDTTTKGGVQSGTPISMRRFTRRRPGLEDAERTVMNCVTYCFHRTEAAEVARLRAPAGGKGAAAAADGNNNNNNGDGGREATVWAVASRVREDLVRQLDRGTKNELAGMLKFVPDHRSLLADMGRKPRQNSLECSNLGVMDGGAGVAPTEALAEHGSWTIDEALFSQSTCSNGPAISINPIAVKGKGLSISFCWQGEVVSGAVAEGVAADTEAWLKRLGREGHLSLSSK